MITPTDAEQPEQSGREYPAIHSKQEREREALVRVALAAARFLEHYAHEDALRLASELADLLNESPDIFADRSLT